MSSAVQPQPFEVRHFEIRRDDLSRCHIHSTTLVDTLRQDQILFRVDRFALTANNITYALTGDTLDYWGFFPAEDGWGRIPAMGYGEVVSSKHPEVAEGTRCYGWFPMASHLLVDARASSSGVLIDTAPHRAKHAVIYRSYTPSGKDPLYDPSRESQIVLLRGLFATSFLIDDFLGDNAFFGARAAVITSASSKTSIGLAWLLAKRDHGPVIGLTSAGNRGFVEELGCYDQVHTYDAISGIPTENPAVIVDMAGNGEVIHNLHHHFGDSLNYSCAVGASHWQADRTGGDLPGPEPQLFFAPKQVEKRRSDWGPGGFEKRLGAAWMGFVHFTDDWLSVLRGRGEDEVERVYREVLAGRARPHQGQVLSL